MCRISTSIVLKISATVSTASYNLNTKRVKGVKVTFWLNLKRVIVLTRSLQTFFLWNSFRMGLEVWRTVGPRDGLLGLSAMALIIEHSSVN